MTTQKEQFVAKCKQVLPPMLRVNNTNYKLHVIIAFLGELRISYAEFNGICFNWENMLIDAFYNIVDEIPIVDKLEKEEDKIYDYIIYKTNIDDVITDCLDKLNTATSNNTISIPDLNTNIFKEITTTKNDNYNSPVDIILKRIETHRKFIEINKQRILKSTDTEAMKILFDSINKCQLQIKEDEAILKLID